MEMRRMENIGVETSLLGFGCMRFPVRADGSIDEPVAEKMIDHAIAEGVNYIDTAYPYHGGESETFVGKVLEKYDRDSFYLATKLPVWAVNTVEDVDKYLDEQLSKLRTDHIDFYLMHAMDKGRWEKMTKIGCVKRLEELKESGKIRYLGFSFHDSYDVFETIITARKWDFCQIQFNYMDTEEQAGTKGYELAERLGIPMVIMEPVKGGSLAKFSDDIMKKFRAIDKDASAASYALRFAGSHPNVKVVLSGMSTPEQVEDNLHTFNNFKPLSDEEKRVIEEVKKIIRSRTKNSCTGCRYCMPCPEGVNIPASFSCWNRFHMYQNYEVVRWTWEEELGDAHQPKNCIECGKCEQACPQHLPIREQLKEVQRDIENAK